MLGAGSILSIKVASGIMISTDGRVVALMIGLASVGRADSSRSSIKGSIGSNDSADFTAVLE